jgi:hypothetical protein
MSVLGYVRSTVDFLGCVLLGCFFLRSVVLDPVLWGRRLMKISVHKSCMTVSLRRQWRECRILREPPPQTPTSLIPSLGGSPVLSGISSNLLPTTVNKAVHCCKSLILLIPHISVIQNCLLRSTIDIYLC